MNQSIQNLSVQKRQAIALIGLTLAAGYLWRWANKKSRAFVIPGSLSTIPDEVGHYDMDGVSFDDHCGVVVGSDGRTPPKVMIPGKKKAAREAAREEKSRMTS